MYRKSQLAFFGGVLLIVSIIVYFNDPTGYLRDNQPKTTSANSSIGSGAGSKSLGAAPKTNSLSAKRERPATEFVEIPSRSLNSLIKEVKSLFDQNEAHRCRLLGESKKSSAQGPATWYLLAVDPPSSEEISAVRKKIANLAAELKGENKQQFDEWAGDLIQSYDPFGILGKRVIIITIPDDPAQKMSAMTYTSDNFESELEKIDPNRKFDYILPNLKLYSRHDSGIIERFEALIKSE